MFMKTVKYIFSIALIIIVFSVGAFTSRASYGEYPGVGDFGYDIWAASVQTGAAQTRTPAPTPATAARATPTPTVYKPVIYSPSASPATTPKPIVSSRPTITPRIMSTPTVKPTSTVKPTPTPTTKPTSTPTPAASSNITATPTVSPVSTPATTPGLSSAALYTGDYDIYDGSYYIYDGADAAYDSAYNAAAAAQHEAAVETAQIYNQTVPGGAAYGASGSEAVHTTAPEEDSSPESQIINIISERVDAADNEAGADDAIAISGGNGNSDGGANAVTDASTVTVTDAVTNAVTNADAEAATNADADSSEADAEYPLLIEITNPTGDEVEIVYKNTYSICGVREDEADPNEPIILYFTLYNAETESYAILADEDGETQWTVGSNGVFTRSVVLGEGENIFAIAACKSQVIEDAISGTRPIEDKDVQIVKFTILYRSQNVAEKINEVIKDLTIENILKEIDNH
jgi:hypothetical protein